MGQINSTQATEYRIKEAHPKQRGILAFLFPLSQSRYSKVKLIIYFRLLKPCLIRDFEA